MVADTFIYLHGYETNINIENSVVGGEGEGGGGGGEGGGGGGGGGREIAPIWNLLHSSSTKGLQFCPECLKYWFNQVVFHLSFPDSQPI